MLRKKQKAEVSDKKESKKAKKKRFLSALISKIEAAGLNPKKEIFFLLCFNFFFLVSVVAVYLYTKMSIASMAVILVAIIMDYFMFNKYQRLKKKKNTKLIDEFVHIFSYFEIFIHNSRPVYNALEDCARYASPSMREYFLSLLSAIDADKSVMPYLIFASHFDSVEIRQVMINIYKMSIEGSSFAYLRQFETIFDALASQKRKELVGRYQEKLNNLNFIPLVDSALSMGMITVAIVVIMGSLASYGF